MRRKSASLVLSVLVAVLAPDALPAGPVPPATQAATAQTAPDRGEASVLKSADAVDPATPIAFSGSLEGAKLAFQAKGADNAEFLLHDQAGNKDLRPARGVWKLTGNSPYVPRYQWAGGNWAPCVYRLDLFGQDSMLWRKVRKPGEGTEFELRFANKKSFQIRNLVVYRGDDTRPPEAADGVTAQAGEDGVRLSWKPAKDNVGVAWYVIARAQGQEKFTKIAQTAEVEFTDNPPATGAWRYRVLAADYERNLGPWSKEASVQAPKAFEPPKPSTAVADSLYHAEHVRAVHETGAGKVPRGTILFHGDCLHYLDRTRDHVASLIPVLPYGCVNESSQVIRPGNPSAKLVKELGRELALRPEFCVLSAGLEDLHPKPFPEDDHTTAEDIQKAVDNVLAMARMCEKQGTVAIVTTPTPFGHNAPKGSPEETLSDELAKMCRENKIPVARVFDMFRQAQEAGEDYKALMTGPPHMFPPGSSHAEFWKRGYEFDPYTPTFELGITRRIIVVKETIDRVIFTLLDRPE